MMFRKPWMMHWQILWETWTSLGVFYLRTKTNRRHITEKLRQDWPTSSGQWKTWRRRRGSSTTIREATWSFTVSKKTEAVATLNLLSRRWKTWISTKSLLTNWPDLSFLCNLGDTKSACHLTRYALREGCQVQWRRCQGGEANYCDIWEANGT